MTIPDDTDADRRIARKNAVREAGKAAKCPDCGGTDKLYGDGRAWGDQGLTAWLTFGPSALLPIMGQP